MHKDIKVAIKCMTYNHEAYIRDALDGFVMQQTDFPFVAIVHDDASTDNTAAIIREYAEKYPNIIKPIYEAENQYSKRDGSLKRIMDAACNAYGAKYIALCEGDDYWTDPLKLQKQVEFLEANPDYTMVFAKAMFHYPEGLSMTTFNVESRDYTALELYKDWIAATPTIVYRRDILNSNISKQMAQIKKPVFGDLTLAMICAHEGKVRGMDDIVCGYRRFPEGATKYLDSHPYLHFCNRLAVSKRMGKRFTQIDIDKFLPTLIPALVYIKQYFPENLLFIILLFRHAPLRCLKELKRIKRPWKHCPFIKKFLN